ncbi:MAG: DUF4215 domain-containing protein, partial [Myxococcota bacterium]
MKGLLRAACLFSLLSCGGGEAPALVVASEDADTTPGGPSNALPGCGDGTAVASEQCDDGNSMDGDCCTNACQLESGCGWTGSAVTSSCEELRIADSDACASDGSIVAGWQCSADECDGALGDERVRGAEQCDDGNADAGDGCSPFGSIEAGYGCVTPRSDRRSECELGFCDDGNTVSGDGCSSSGQIEPGFACIRLPAADLCDGAWGDGASVGTEECDDGNSVPGDGCFRGAVEAGFACDSGTLVPSQCTTECDDGNSEPFDGCTQGRVDPTASCRIDPGMPSICGDARCTSRGCYEGNGIQDGFESDTDCGGGLAPACDAPLECRTGLDC